MGMKAERIKNESLRNRPNSLFSVSDLLFSILMTLKAKLKG